MMRTILAWITIAILLASSPAQAVPATLAFFSGDMRPDRPGTGFGPITYNPQITINQELLPFALEGSELEIFFPGDFRIFGAIPAAQYTMKNAGLIETGHSVFNTNTGDPASEIFLLSSTFFVGEVFTSVKLKFAASGELESFRWDHQGDCQSYFLRSAVPATSNCNFLDFDWVASGLPRVRLLSGQIGTVTPIPLPASAPLLLLGLAGLAAIGRRRAA